MSTFLLQAEPAQALGLALDLVTLSSASFVGASQALAAAEGYPNRLTLEQHVSLTRILLVRTLETLPAHFSLHGDVLRFFDEVTAPWLLAQHTPRPRTRLTLVPNES